MKLKLAVSWINIKRRLSEQSFNFFLGGTMTLTGYIHHNMLHRNGPHIDLRLLSSSID